MKKKAAIHSRRPLLIARARLVQLDLVKAKVAGESDKGTSKPSCVCIFPSPRKGRTHLQCTVFFQERDEKCFFQGKSQCSLGKGVTPPGIQKNSIRSSVLRQTWTPLPWYEQQHTSMQQSNRDICIQVCQCLHTTQLHFCCPARRSSRRLLLSCHRVDVGGMEQG